MVCSSAPSPFMFVCCVGFYSAAGRDETFYGVQPRPRGSPTLLSMTFNPLNCALILITLFACRCVCTDLIFSFCYYFSFAPVNFCGDLWSLQPADSRDSRSDWCRECRFFPHHPLVYEHVPHALLQSLVSRKGTALTHWYYVHCSQVSSDPNQFQSSSLMLMYCIDRVSQHNYHVLYWRTV